MVKAVEGGGAARPSQKVEAPKAKQQAEVKHPTQPTVNRDKFSRGGKAIKLRDANKVPERKDPFADPPVETKRIAELEDKLTSGKKLTKDESRELLTLLNRHAQRANQRADAARVEREAKKQHDDAIANLRG